MDLELEDGLVLVGYSLHLAVEGCRADCHENHLDLPGYHLCHLEGDHRLLEAVGIEAAAVGIRTGVAAADGSMEEDLEEAEEEGSCIAEHQPSERCMKGLDATRVLLQSEVA